MKVVAMYLPQFHRCKENDEWWGEGFTDWVTVKSAKKYVEGQIQPRVPLNRNYYDLLSKDVMEWQALLMKKYGIDGVCIYHYWFKDGRQVLEKPTENLLSWKDIDMPFCICWANETWARSWSNIKAKNVWADVLENDSQKSDSILLEQSYGIEEDWRKHFEYLLPFFRDKRYIRIDEKPVIVFYNVNHISCLTEMINMWRKMAVDSGLGGLYIIGRNANFYKQKDLDGVFLQEPQKTFGKQIKRRNLSYDELRVFDYDQIWDEILSYQEVSEKDIFYGGFCEYDDTPRRGTKGQIVLGHSPEKFERYFSELLSKNEASNVPITFLNAWNEWGEGMYLEPDECDGFKFLEAVLKAKNQYRSINISKYHTLERKEIEELKRQDIRNYRFITIFDRWMGLYEKNTDIIKERLGNSKSVAIYGMGMLGKHLLHQLKDSMADVRYVIDREKKDGMDIEVYQIEDNLPFVDIVIVTVFAEYDSIKRRLENKNLRTVSIEDLILR